jgi:EpsI family protein
MLHAGVAAAAMFAASATGSLLKPHELIADRLPPIDLAGSIPAAFGDWRVVTSGSQGIVNPGAIVLALHEIYSQLLNRTYVNTRTQRMVMLAVPTGAKQSDALAVHLPDVCYPRRASMCTRRAASSWTSARIIPVRRLVTEAPRRPEPLTYWTTVGDRGRRRHAAAQADPDRFGMHGLVPDGLVFRVSSIGNEPDEEFRIQKERAGPVLAIPESQRARFVWTALVMRNDSVEVAAACQDVSALASRPWCSSSPP